MNQRRPGKALLSSPRGWQFRRLLVGVVASSAIGAILLVRIFAASTSLSFEAESGTLSGDATLVSDSSASGGSAVQLGGNAPTNLQAYTGGNNIALVWDMPTVPAQQIQVFRNDIQIATVSPNASAPFQNGQIGKEYDDNAVSSGSTYQYKVRAVSTSGAVSAFSPTITATQPTNSEPVPSLTIDTSQATNLTSYMNTNLPPLIKTWYPKLADEIAYPAFNPPTSLSFAFNTSLGPSYVCGTSAPNTICDPGWMTNSIAAAPGNPPGNDMAAVILHELTRDLQVYPNDTTGFARDGIASWTSDFFARQNINNYVGHSGEYPALLQFNTDAWFIQYMTSGYDPAFAKDVNVAEHNNTYSDSIISQDSGGKFANPQQAWQAATSAYNSPVGTITGNGGKCAEVLNGTVALGTKVVLDTCNNLSQTVDVNVTFNSGISGKCLDDWLGSSTSNADLYSCNNSTSQWWTIASDGTIKSDSGGCLDDSPNANGNQVTLATCNAGDSKQQWTVNNNTIKNPATGKCLDDPGSSTTDSTALDMYTCNGTNAQKWAQSGGMTLSGDFPQQWALTYHSQSKDGFFEITSPSLNTISGGGGWCMDVTSSGTADGTNVQYWGCDQTAAQYWTLGANGSLVNVNSGKCLDTTTGSSANGTQLVINTCNGSPSQNWTTPASGAGISCVTMPASASTDAITTTAPAAGTYQVWARVKSIDTTDSALYLQNDQAACANTVGGGYVPANTWTWVNYHDGNASQPLNVSLNAGSHTITLGALSPGLQVDNVILTTDDSCIPTGSGANCTTGGTGVIGDLNNDGKVNIYDLSILLSDWNTSNANADLNHDGTVNIFDLSILLSHWTG